jgi:hypothetical protein
MAKFSFGLWQFVLNSNTNDSQTANPQLSHYDL